jgi:RNA polymerase sigma-70 factor (ECF subfamily)
MSDIGDWQLVAQARDGDMDAFGELVRRYERPVVHFCQRMLGSLEEAEDLAQETFVRLYRYLPRLEPRAQFSTALFGMARNLTLNTIRDSKRRGRGKTQSMTREDETERAAPDGRHQPDRTARQHEAEALIGRALTHLSPEHREVLVLRELQGMDYEEIAKVIRARKGTVKSRLARAREQLRLRLLELGGDEI